MNRFNDPLSELNVVDRGSPWITHILKPISEFWVRIISAPFFIIGVVVIVFRLIFYRQHRNDFDFWVFAIVLTLIYISIVSLLGGRNSRYLFVFDPLIIAIGMFGFGILWRYCARKCFAIGATTNL